MYRISYEKCVCFIFLVILAVLSCSGFRIDNLAMTDISKRNSHTSSSLLNSDEFFDRLFSVNATAPTFRHRIRHHRQLRAQAHTSRVLTPTPQPNEHFAQIPSTDLHQNPLLPTRSITRSQRSNDQNRKNRKHYSCPEHDVSWKAYKANAIVIAKVESKSSKCKENCTVFFKVIERLKNSSFPVDEHFRLKFSSHKGATNCEYDDLNNRSQFLVRTKIEQSKEYILFLNTYSAHNFSAVFVPEIRKRKTLNIINRVINPNFKPKAVRLDKHSPGQNRTNFRRLKLTCKLRGFPIPIIYWKHNNVLIHPNPRQRITQRKRKSTLVILNVTDADLGRYECVVRGVDGKETSAFKDFQSISRRPTVKPDAGIYSSKDFQSSSRRPTLKPDPGIYSSDDRRPTVTPDPGIYSSHDRIPCEEPYRDNYCYNGGSCFFIESMRELACACDTGYTGNKCEQKTSDQSSMYRQTPIYTCKIGLYTKYDNC